jgi:multiple sugar transport system ATP-binding protein
MASISIENVSKRYGDGALAVNDVSLDVADGEFVVLVGPSGCGKSTLLRMIAGLEEISDGRIVVNGKVVNDLPAKDRDIAMVFQTYALFPHMTVERNLSFGLRLRGTPRAETERRVREAAALLRLEPLMKRRPGQLSGGQRQRVAIGRALVREPAAFLMDEPLSNLDAKLRVHMRTEFARLRERLRTTTVYVTHDQVEAMTLGDRVCVMRDGLVQQVDTPEQLFTRPRNIFVAGFIGSPEMNFAAGRVEGGELRLGSFRFPLPASAAPPAGEGRPVVVGLRPSDIREMPGRETVEMQVQVELVERLGSEILAVFPVDAAGVSADSVAAGDGAAMMAGREGRTSFTARLDAGTPAAAGRPISLYVNPAAIHLFDPETGMALRQGGT